MKRIGAPLLALAALALALLAAEGVARLVWDPPRYHNEPLRLDPELGFAGIPDHRSRSTDAEGALHALVLNRDGFRGRPLPPAAGSRPGDDAPRLRRIAFVGDSFLVGAGVAEGELLNVQVEQALTARGEAVETWNLSAADYGTGQELLLLRRLGARLAPDVVVLAVYPQNDLVNNYEGLAFRTQVSPGDTIRPYVDPQGGRLHVRYLHPLRAPLRHHSRLFAVLERRAIAFGARRGLAWLHPFVLPTPPLERIAHGRAPWEHQEIFRSHPPEDDWERAWQRTTRLLAAFRDACAALSTRLLVVVIPDLHQVQRVAQDVEMDLRLRELQRVPLDRYLDWNLPERRLAGFFREQGIEFVALLPALRRAAADGEQVYLRDRHLSARGHAVAAVEVLAALDALDGVEPTRPPLDLAPGGRPVRLPRAGRAPRMIEPAREAQWPFRGEGWIPWQASPDAPPGGALPLQQALVAVPVRGHELVVRGIAAAHRYPLDLTLELVSGPRHDFRIERPGPFVLRARLPVARLPTSDGYLAVLFSSQGEAESELSTGLIVQEIGFPGS